MNKKRKQIIREKDAEHRRREQEALIENHKRLASMTGGFARTASDSFLVKPKRIQPANRLREAEIQKAIVPARPQAFVMRKAENTPEYDETMQAREQAALKRYEEMKARTAPVYNKGGYQYLGELDLAEFQRGGTRRR